MFFQSENRIFNKMAGNDFTTQENLQSYIIVIYNDHDSPFFILNITLSLDFLEEGSRSLQTPSRSTKPNPICKKRTQGKTLKTADI